MSQGFYRQAMTAGKDDGLRERSLVPWKTSGDRVVVHRYASNQNGSLSNGGNDESYIHALMSRLLVAGLIVIVMTACSSEAPTEEPGAHIPEAAGANVTGPGSKEPRNFHHPAPANFPFGEARCVKMLPVMG